MQLMLAIYFMAVEKHDSNPLAALVIGFALFISELPGIYYTGGSLNPARTFGPDLVMFDFGGAHWIYWLGPLFGKLSQPQYMSAGLNKRVVPRE